MILDFQMATGRTPCKPRVIGYHKPLTHFSWKITSLTSVCSVQGSLVSAFGAYIYPCREKHRAKLPVLVSPQLGRERWCQNNWNIIAKKLKTWLSKRWYHVRFNCTVEMGNVCYNGQRCLPKILKIIQTSVHLIKECKLAHSDKLKTWSSL